MENSEVKALKIFAILIIIGLLLFLPIIPVQVVPEVTLKVINAEGNPLPGVVIIQFWRHWTYDATDRRDEVMSNAEGDVTFAEKKIWVSAGKFLYGKFGENVWSYIDIHAGFGPDNGFRAKDYKSENKWCNPCNKDRISENKIVILERIK